MRNIPARKQSRLWKRSYNRGSGELNISRKVNLYSRVMIVRNKSDIGLTIPIRFSRHRITELLVAAEQTASFFPYQSKWKRIKHKHH